MEDICDFEAIKLSYPFYVYPGYPCSGYNDVSTYKKYTLKLYKKINEMKNELSKNNKKILFHLTIGATMEEYFNLFEESKTKYKFQYQQLCPEHLINEVLDGNSVVNFIISPTSFFSLDNFSMPFFVNELDHIMNWEYDIENEYVVIKSRNYDFKIYIYCTMMPSNDERNESIVENLNRIINTDIILPIEDIRQTTEDRIFINKFYNCFNDLFKIIIKNKGTVTCFSYAVFHTATNKISYNNFKMFRELIELIDWNNENMFIGEWIFTEGCYVVISKSTELPVIYVDLKTLKNKNSKNGIVLRINKNGNILYSNI